MVLIVLKAWKYAQSGFLAVKEENQHQNWCNPQGGDSKSATALIGNNYGKSSAKISTQVELIDYILYLLLVLTH